MLAFHGRAPVKALVLRQMQEHLENGDLGAVVVDGVRLHLYGWGPHALDYAACEATLGIPQDLMRVASWLYQGFPDGPAGVRDVVRARRRFFEAIPVGRDLAGVAEELVLAV